MSRMKSILMTICFTMIIWSGATQEIAQVEGTVQLGHYDLTSANPEAGTIQWTGSDLVGFNGTKWVSLTTGVVYDGIVEDTDGNTYYTIKIGTQEWMAENLRTKFYNNGSPIDVVTSSNNWGKTNLTNQGAYCWYDNNPENGKVYGALYNWYTVNSGNLCPSGWSVPSAAQWDVLSNFLGGNNDSGGKLKAEFEIYWGFPNVGATNESGFTAQPGGQRTFEGNFEGKSDQTYYWTSSELSTNGQNRSIVKQFDNLFGSSSDKRSGYSIRCIKD